MSVKLITLEGGEQIYAHEEHDCLGLEDKKPCTIHAMTQHSMRAFPQHWREDRGIMERICPHGVGHPDPDDYFVYTKRDDGVHGCDRCCSPKRVRE